MIQITIKYKRNNIITSYNNETHASHPLGDISQRSLVYIIQVLLIGAQISIVDFIKLCIFEFDFVNLYPAILLNDYH